MVSDSFVAKGPNIKESEHNGMMVISFIHLQSYTACDPRGYHFHVNKSLILPWTKLQETPDESVRFAFSATAGIVGSLPNASFVGLGYES